MASIPNIQCGNFRHRVSIQSGTFTQDSMGENIPPTWATDNTVWGAVEPVSGKETFQADQVDARVTHMVIMRYYPGLTSEMRILYVKDADSRVLNIESVRNIDERDRRTIAMCTEDPTNDDC